MATQPLLSMNSTVETPKNRPTINKIIPEKYVKREVIKSKPIMPPNTEKGHAPTNKNTNYQTNCAICVTVHNYLHIPN